MDIHAVVTSSIISRISGDNFSAEGMIFTRVTWRDYIQLRDVILFLGNEFTGR
jgi:hypothetical protein